MSRRFTDILDLDRDLFHETASGWDFYIQLAISRHHLLESVLQHFSALLQGLALRNHFRPFDELPHVAGWNLRIFRRVRLGHAFTRIVGLWSR